MHAMSAPAPTSTSRTIDLGDRLTIAIEERGDAEPDGSAVLLLHGGAGPRSVAGLAAALSEHTHVITPTHPGFDGQPRPDWADSIGDLADAYLDLVDVLGLRGVLVIGNSIGGWIAAEIALRDNHARVSGLVLLDSTGVQPSRPDEIANPAAISPAELIRLAFHNPAMRPNPAATTDEQRAVAAANQRTMAVYAGTQYDPKLRRRLHRVTVPVLVAWGEQDGVVPLSYGRALAGAFPRATFQPIADAAHFPHMEQPGATLGVIGDFVQKELKPADG
jgi:pimeloyl-ACP methyl ester carboxylesterase